MALKKAAIYLALVLTIASGCATVGHFRGEDSFARGLALFNQGRFAASILHFEAATREDPEFAQAYFYLGRAFVSESRWRAAIQPLRTAFRLAPEAAKQEIMNLLVDATFSAALNDFNLGDRIAPPARFKDTL
jgi:tetratricopeptide (TPR) repeat protein